jgi:hypothetical protein
MWLLLQAAMISGIKIHPGRRFHDRPSSFHRSEVRGGTRTQARSAGLGRFYRQLSDHARSLEKPNVERVCGRGNRSPRRCAARGFAQKARERKNAGCPGPI